MNARSIVYKTTKLRNLVNCNSPSIVCNVETWLNNTYTNNFFQLQDYQLFRMDRDSENGGVLMAVKHKHRAVQVDIESKTEIIAIDLMLESESLRIITAYIPHSSDVKYFKKNFEFIIISHCKNFYIFGDLIFPYFNWQTLTYPFTKPYIQFSDFIFNNSPIYQFVNFQSKGDHILDLILSNNSTFVKQLIPNAPLEMSDHVTLGVLNLTYSTSKHATLKYF